MQMSHPLLYLLSQYLYLAQSTIKDKLPSIMARDGIDAQDTRSSACAPLLIIHGAELDRDVIERPRDLFPTKSVSPFAHHIDHTALTHKSTNVPIEDSLDHVL
jgi:hypothetical protein